MPFGAAGTLRPALLAVGAVVIALSAGSAKAQDKTYVMKIGLPTINDAPHQFAKDENPV
jgi:hypothetical protein